MSRSGVQNSDACSSSKQGSAGCEPYSVPEPKLGIYRAGDEQSSRMQRAMMTAAQGDEIACVVTAAIGAHLHMMKIEKGNVTAAGDLVAMLVSS